jgi:lipopolysaccharide transport system permease protein
MTVEQQIGGAAGIPSAKPKRRAVSYRRAGRESIDVVRHSFTWRALALADIRSKYRRTALGPWWLTASNGLMALGIGVVFGGFFGSDQRTYIPYFITGMTVWNFISSAINESSGTLVQSSELIKATQMPLTTYVMRAVQRNFLIFMHNIMIIPVIWLFLPWGLQWTAFLSIFGLVIVFVFASSISLTIAFICVRYRDMPPLVGVVLQFLFFISPIIWMPEKVRAGHLALILNPFTYMLSIARDPLLSRPVELIAWPISLGVTLLSVAIAAAVYMRYRNRVVYWV